jgi:transposase
MDMSGSCSAAMKEHFPEAEQKIVFDYFQVSRYVTPAFDKVRLKEHKTLNAKSHKSLGTKYPALKNVENVPEWR